MYRHEDYIKRCLHLAKNALGTSQPNPMVGAVIVCNNKIIGEGFTSTYGSNHAEVNAINAVKDKSLLSQSKIYVTLEPCSHFGKTPPCSDLIIRHKIPEIIIGCIDDNPKVAGRGIQKLKAAGCKVTVGVLEKECKTHHKRFFVFHNKKRPYIILKWAETQDGFIAPKSKLVTAPVWITNPYSRQLAHKWRAEEQAILVGTNTVIEDDPSLTVRDWKGKNPIRIILDKTKRLNAFYRVFKNDAKTIKITRDLVDYELPLAAQICDLLYKKNISSVIIEGGTKTIQTFIDENLWDEGRIFVGETQFHKGTIAPSITGTRKSSTTIKGDTLNIYVKN